MPDMNWLPHERDGILIVSVTIAVSVIAVFMADVSYSAMGLGWFDQLRFSKIELFRYEKSIYEGFDYLIKVDLITILLICFLLLMYGVLVYINILPRPVIIWNRLKEQFGEKSS